jgi:hypothetical protein
VRSPGQTASPKEPTVNATALATALVLLAAQPRHEHLSYPAVVDRVAGMVSDGEVQALASEKGLQLLDVLWEDTGRSVGSSMGPNISDVTIEVVSEDRGARKLALMPVLRFPNFVDRTADVRLDKVWLKVGNERDGSADRTVSLKEFLASPGRFLSGPDAGRIKGGSLLAPRDTHALVSAQAAFLPVPQGGKATFHPVVFNYQSTRGHPAVLTLLVTRQGTSLTVIDNARDTVSGGASWGQRLFFNSGGERAPLTAERLADVQASGTTMNGEAAASLGADANLLMLVQVPLVVHRPQRKLEALGGAKAMSAPAPAMAQESKAADRARSDMDVAVLGHGELDGPFTELAGLTVERDPRFPVRVTVQFYQATATGKIGRPEVARLAERIDAVYTKGDYVGSLVVPAPQDLARPTRWQPRPEGPVCRPSRPDLCEYPGLAERWGVCCPPGPPPAGVW